MDLGTEVIKFVQNTYSRKCRVRLTNTALKPLEESIRRAEEDLSKEEFRAALCQYLDTSDDWLRENKWPIRKFLKSPLDYLRAPARPLDSTAHSAIEPGSTGGEIRPIGEMTGTATRTSVPELTSGGISSPTGSTPVQPEYLTYVDKWNTLIPERAVGVLPSFTVDAIQPQIKNRDFALAFDTVVAKCRKLAAVKRTEVSFLWLFSKTKDGPIWQQVYMGKYDWLMSPKGGEGEAALSPTQRLIEKKRKEKLAREAAGE